MGKPVSLDARQGPDRLAALDGASSQYVIAFLHHGFAEI
jgi:hypothetical protein